MAWFNRKERGIITPTEKKLEAPDGLWYQCPECKGVMQTKEHETNKYTCVHCDYHARLGSKEYWELSKQIASDDEDEPQYDPNKSGRKPSSQKINVKKIYFQDINNLIYLYDKGSPHNQMTQRKYFFVLFFLNLQLNL